MGLLHRPGLLSRQSQVVLVPKILRAREHRRYVHELVRAARLGEGSSSVQKAMLEELAVKIASMSIYIHHLELGRIVDVSLCTSTLLYFS